MSNSSAFPPVISEQRTWIVSSFSIIQFSRLDSHQCIGVNMPPSVATPSKDEWRARFRAYRESLSPERYIAKSTHICQRAFSLSVLTRANVVHVYWPLCDQCEVDTRSLISALRSQGTDVVLPVVTSYDPANPTMEHRLYTGASNMTLNRWGIREPVETESIPPEALDAVVVPALGADHNGHRLGYGTGYYDAFLQAVDIPRIILVYEECFVPRLPSEPHDVPSTAVVTERKWTPISNS